jgi:virginiamycin B lyase
MRAFQVRVLVPAAIASVLFATEAHAWRIRETALPTGGGFTAAGICVDGDDAISVLGETAYENRYYSDGMPFSGGLVTNAVKLRRVVAGPTGYWYGELDANKIHYVPYLGSPLTSTIPTASAGLQGMAVGPDGNLWFCEYGANKIGRLTPGGTFTEFPITTTPDSGPFDITAASDGNLYFTEYLASKVGKITTSGVISDFPLTTPASGPAGITASKSLVVICEYLANKIASFPIINPNFRPELAVPTAGGGPLDVVAGPDGDFFFTEYSGNKIGRFDGGNIYEYPVPTAASQPYDIALTRGGRIVFTERGAGQLGLLELVASGDVNGDGLVSVADVFYLINFLFAGGSAPK